MFTCSVSNHRLRTPGEEIAFTAQPKIKSQSQIFMYCRSIFCLPHRPKFLDIFDLCLHWVSVVRDCSYSCFYSCSSRCVDLNQSLVHKNCLPYFTRQQTSAVNKKYVDVLKEGRQNNIALYIALEILMLFQK